MWDMKLFIFVGGLGKQNVVLSGVRLKEGTEGK